MKSEATRNITLVDTETTGLNVDNDEVIGIGLLCLRVDDRTGQIAAVLSSSVQWREPPRMSEEAESVVGITRPQLKGRQIELAEIERILAETDLVVAHNAAFDRPFVELLCPKFIELPWACSLTDVDWRLEGDFGGASICRLLRRYGLGESSGTPEADCAALARLLSHRTGEAELTGFQQLMRAANKVRVWCAARNDPKLSVRAVDALAGLGFVTQGLAWQADCASPAAADELERTVIGECNHPELRALTTWRDDAFSRFSTRGRPLRPGADDEAA